MRGAVGRWQGELGDTHVLGLVRVALGVLWFGSALRAANELRAGYFGDVFHWPLLPEWLVLPRAAYHVLVLAQVVLSVLVVLGGVGARSALLASAVGGSYVLLCDRLEFHNNRWALCCYSALVALSPCDRSFVFARVGGGLRVVARSIASPARIGPLWAARLAQVQLCIIYLASGGSKLLDGDWRGGQVLRERFRLSQAAAAGAGVPDVVIEALSRPAVTCGLATVAIVTELLLPVGLWGRRTRALALWWGVGFHLAIQATSRVEAFTWLTLVVYALFATPDVGGRALLYDASRASGRAAARGVRWLDWLARFRYEALGSARSPESGAEHRRGSARSPESGAEHRRGSARSPAAVVVVDRDGTRSTGVAALALIARCTPLLFPIWVPLAIVARVARGKDGA
jgi:hypothetical protein